ncbi:MAG: dihydroorotase [Alphaproteobacteria bacterium]|nr:dihydroorotase [Alphaproteobacteria bacterium]
MPENTLSLCRPDDWHLHLRDGAMLKTVLPWTARQFARAIVMPNLLPPITTVAAARAYRDRIIAALPPDSDFSPLMTCYLTDDTDPAEVARGHGEGVFTAVKLYPARATTNSAFGVTDYDRIMPVLGEMAALGMPLLIHGEATDPEIDVFDREAVFIERVLDPLRRRLPELPIVLEHITTAEAVSYVEGGGANLAATITAHHLIINRNAIFEGGIRPHLYCLPIAKREKHRLALRRAATSGRSCFFLGTDSAPHAIATKETACGCAGIFTASCALELYAEIFEQEGALDRLEAFAAINGAIFYGLPVNAGRVLLRRERLRVAEQIGEGAAAVRPFRAGETLRWRLAPAEQQLL